MTAKQVCRLCGHESTDVTIGLVRWREPIREHDYYSREPRCQDVDACRSRMAFDGEPWPVDDGYTEERVMLT